MEIERPNREIPDRIREEYNALVEKGITELRIGNYENAVGIFQKIYDLLLKTQKEEDRPIHKGLPLHNLGIALFYLKKLDEALYNILLAYVEDTLNVDYDFEDEADRAPAATALRDVFYFNLRILREIKTISSEIKKSGKWDKVRDPENILIEAAKRLKFDPKKLTKECKHLPTIGKPLIGFPQPREKRVFIGTNYDKNPAVIPVIKEAVVSKNYIPIVAADYGINPDTTHDDCLVLMHTCKYAIFDITSPGGQLMELERAHDYKVEVLLVRQSMDPANLRIPPMIKSLGYNVEGYRDYRDLRDIVRKFLP